MAAPGPPPVAPGALRSSLCRRDLLPCFPPSPQRPRDSSNTVPTRRPFLLGFVPSSPHFGDLPSLPRLGVPSLCPQPIECRLPRTNVCLPFPIPLSSSGNIHFLNPPHRFPILARAGPPRPWQGCHDVISRSPAYSATASGMRGSDGPGHVGLPRSLRFSSVCPPQEANGAWGRAPHRPAQLVLGSPGRECVLGGRSSTNGLRQTHAEGRKANQPLSAEGRARGLAGCRDLALRH